MTEFLSGLLLGVSQGRVLVSVQPDKCDVLGVGPQEGAALVRDRSSGPGLADRAGAMNRAPDRLSGDSLRMEEERITCWEADRVFSRSPE
ncbi:MAG: hypothetical protein ACYCTI_05820 [Acidimicrobiales bacterium]